MDDNILSERSLICSSGMLSSLSVPVEHLRRRMITSAASIGINVGIPVPVGISPLEGHKNSFFGDLHTLGKDGLRFYTETKCDFDMVY